jgi:hypothetical protein
MPSQWQLPSRHHDGERLAEELWFKNNMTEHGMVSHNIAQQNKWQTIPSTSKTIGTVFLNAEGWLLVKFMPYGEIINAAHYLYMIQKLQHVLCDKYPGKENITLQQDNAGSHTAVCAWTS